VDDQRRPLPRRAEPAFLDEPIAAGHFALRVAQQREAQAKLPVGAGQLFDRLGGDSDDDGLVSLRRRHPLVQLLAVGAAARVVRALEEIDNGVGVAGVVMLGDDGAVVRGELVGRRLLQAAHGFGLGFHR